MGCGNPREDIEDKIMLIRIKRMKIQMEREKNLKILSDLEGYTINIDNLPDYLASSNKAKLVDNLNSEKKDNNNNNIYKQNQPPNNQNIEENDNSPTLINNSVRQIGNIENEKEKENNKEFPNKDKIELNNNIVDNNNVVDNNNMVDNNNSIHNNNSQILRLDSPKRIKKKKVKRK